MKSRLIFTLLFSLIPVIAVFVGNRTIGLSPDGKEYLEIARSLIDGSFWNIVDSTDTPFYWFHRLPLYPLILGFFIRFIPNEASAVLICHLVVTLLMLYWINSLLLSRNRPFLAAGFLAIALVPNLFFARLVLAEWFCVLCLTLLALQVIRHMEAPSNNSLLISTALASSLCAMRAALIPSIIIPIVAASVTTGGLRTLRTLFLGLLPLGLVILANFLRFDSPQISYVLGHQMAVVGELVGGASSSSQTHLQQRDYDELVRDSTQRVVALESLRAPLDKYYALDMTPEHTLYTLLFSELHRIREELSLSFLEADSLAFEYGKAAIKEHFFQYCAFILTGLVASRLPILLVLILFATFMLKKLSAPRCDYQILAIFGFFFFLYALEVSSLQYVIPRYVDPVFYPVLAAIFLVLAKRAASNPNYKCPT